MNTLICCRISDAQPNEGSLLDKRPSGIAGAKQQMSISFGVATASLVTALFIPDRFHSTAPQMIHGIHDGFFVLGGLTVLSTIVFRELKSLDGNTTSQHKVLEHAD
jgi:hypothetical protein